MPPRRTGIGHGLYDEILDRQRLAQVFRKPASLRVMFGEICQDSRLSVETARNWIDNAGFRSVRPFRSLNCSRTARWRENVTSFRRTSCKIDSC